MEDRLSPRLHLELVRYPDTLGDRVFAVASAGWEVSTWEPCRMPVDEISRREKPCLSLVVGEGAGVRPSEPSASTTTITMARHPRPTQGSCSGEETNGLLLVLISPKDRGEAQQLRDWGDFVHLRHIAEAGVPGYRTISVYENEENAGPMFCHLYEMHTEDPQSAFAAMTPLVRQRVEDFRGWAWHPQLVIDESRTFRRLT